MQCNPTPEALAVPTSFADERVVPTPRSIGGEIHLVRFPEHGATA